MKAIGLVLAAIAATISSPVAAQSDTSSASYAPVAETFLVERAEISPDGTRVAYVAVRGDLRFLRMEQLDGSLVQQADLKARAELRDLAWAGNDHILLTFLREVSTQPDVDNGVFSTVSYNVALNAYETLLVDRSDTNTTGTRTATLFPPQPRTLPIVFGRPAVRMLDGKATVFVDTVTFDGSCRYDVYRSDLDTGSARLMRRGMNQMQGMVLDERAGLVAVQQGGRLRMVDGAAMRRPSARSAQGPVELLGLGRSGDSALVRDEAGVLLDVSAKRGRTAEPLDVGGLSDAHPIYDDSTGRLLGVVGRDGEGRRAYHFFERALARVWPSVMLVFGENGADVQLASWSADFQRLVVFVETGDTAEYQMIDMATGLARLLAPSYPENPHLKFDRTGTTSAADIRSAAAARIEDPRRLCSDMRGTG